MSIDDLLKRMGATQQVWMRRTMVSSLLNAAMAALKRRQKRVRLCLKFVGRGRTCRLFMNRGPLGNVIEIRGNCTIAEFDAAAIVAACMETVE